MMDEDLINEVMYRGSHRSSALHQTLPSHENVNIRHGRRERRERLRQMPRCFAQSAEIALFEVQSGFSATVSERSVHASIMHDLAAVEEPMNDGTGEGEHTFEVP